MLLYLILINAVAFLCMLIDKIKAKKVYRRIPEATLLLLAAAGGSVGTYLGMQFFRHKTRKPKFYIGVPVILVLQVMCLLICFQLF